jgi:hypothetical protein
MRNFLLILISVLIAASASAQRQNVSRSENVTIAHELAFEVETAKKTLLPLEPLIIRFRLVNLSDKSLPVDRPEFLQDARLRVMHSDGSIMQVDRLTVSHGRGLPVPGSRTSLPPHGSYDLESVLSINPEYLEEPGKYHLVFFLHINGRSLESNILALQVDRPTGVDMQAYAYLVEHGKDPWFGSVFNGEMNDRVLATFVDRFRSAAYGEYAASSLGKHYLYNGKLDQAKAEFDRLASSKNQFLRNQALKDLAEAERRRIAAEDGTTNDRPSN